MNFDGKVVIITGASSGIGAAIAIKFAEHKAKVVIVDIIESKLIEVSKKCQKYDVIPLMIIADVTIDRDIKNIIRTTITQCGKIDILINNAGILRRAAIEDDTAMQVFDQIMATNLRGVVFLTSQAAPYLVETRGNIVNISSIAAVDVINRNYFAYCASKAALDHFTRCIALDLGPKGVRVNTVNPGPVETDILNDLGFEKDEQKNIWKNMAAASLFNRVSSSEEIADLVLFVSSDKAKAITGSSIITDNGMLLQRNKL